MGSRLTLEWLLNQFLWPEAGLANIRPSRRVLAALSHLNNVSNTIKRTYYNRPAEHFYLLARYPPSGPWHPPHSRGFLWFLDHTPQSVGLIWTSDQLVAETSTWQHTTLKTNIYALGGIRNNDLSRRAVVDLRLRLRGHWDRLYRTIWQIY
jgi:hypothetical protein